MERFLFDPELRQPCLLCDGPPAVAGLFIPVDPAALGAPEGKARVIRYFLCQKCFDRGQQATDDAERKIRAEARFLLTDPDAN